jgi:hypothetical protein
VTVGDIGIAGDGTGKWSDESVVKRGTRPEKEKLVVLKEANIVVAATLIMIGDK